MPPPRAPVRKENIFRTRPPETPVFSLAPCPSPVCRQQPNKNASALTPPCAHFSTRFPRSLPRRGSEDVPPALRGRIPKKKTCPQSADDFNTPPSGTLNVRRRKPPRFSSPVHQPPAGVPLEREHRLADALHCLVRAGVGTIPSERGRLPVLEQEGHSPGFEARDDSGRRRGSGRLLAGSDRCHSLGNPGGGVRFVPGTHAWTLQAGERAEGGKRDEMHRMKARWVRSRTLKKSRGGGGGVDVGVAGMYPRTATAERVRSRKERNETWKAWRGDVYWRHAHIHVGLDHV